MACVTAYNDWMVEEWCGDSNGRLIPLGIIPLWDVPAAAAEVRRNAARGVRAVCFSELPYHLNLPTAPGNEAFDADLRSRDPAWGLRWLGQVAREARQAGFVARANLEMPANNRVLVFQCSSERPTP